jgi:hypothetical protein
VPLPITGPKTHAKLDFSSDCFAAVRCNPERALVQQEPLVGNGEPPQVVIRPLSPFRPLTASVPRRNVQPETRPPQTLRAPGSFGKSKRSQNKGDQAKASAIASVSLKVGGATL